MTARRDALADAATFRLVTRLQPDAAEVAAYSAGGWVVYHLARREDEAAACCAVAAARLAFRAFPGLRESVGPLCVWCGSTFDHGCNSAFCSERCEAEAVRQ